MFSTAVMLRRRGAVSDRVLDGVGVHGRGGDDGLARDGRPRRPAVSGWSRSCARSPMSCFRWACSGWPSMPDEGRAEHRVRSSRGWSTLAAVAPCARLRQARDEDRMSSPATVRIRKSVTIVLCPADPGVPYAMRSR